MSRAIIDRLICSPLNSRNGIKLSMDKPLNNPCCLNIVRPAVLRQYYGKVINSPGISIRQSLRYTYGSGSGTSSVGMDPKNYVTRPLSHEMESMIDEIYNLLKNNQSALNLSEVNMEEKFNHCTILLYYSGEDLKEKSSLGFHTDCVYNLSDLLYNDFANSQAENTPAVIYSLGDTRELNWRQRVQSVSKSGRKKWITTNNCNVVFALASDTLTIINPLDENPKSLKNRQLKTQYQHGNVNVSGEKFSVALVFRVCKNTGIYWKVDDTQTFEGQRNENGNVIQGCLGFNFSQYHYKLKRLYHSTMF